MQVSNLDHLGIVAGVIDEMGIVEEINKKVGRSSREKVKRTGVIVKAMILNGLSLYPRRCICLVNSLREKQPSIC
jgi:transposase